MKIRKCLILSIEILGAALLVSDEPTLMKLVWAAIFAFIFTFVNEHFIDPWCMSKKNKREARDLDA